MQNRKEYYAAYHQANKEKRRAQAAEWAKRNPDKIRAMAKKTQAKRRSLGKDIAVRLNWESRNREYILWNAAKQRSKKSGVEFTIKKADIFIPSECPLTGIKINRQQRGRMQQSSPSLDRIDPAKGYTPDNVWVISWQANRMKSDATQDQLLKFAHGILKLFGSHE